MATGFVSADGRRKISIEFEEDAFDRIQEIARADGCSFGHAARKVVRVGLASIDKTRSK
jgi:protein-disulfide isomerase-like protein with CxxC motif